MKRRSIRVFSFLAATLASAGAFAQPTRSSQLFDQAVDEFNAENYAAACPHFEESLQLEKNGGTLFHLAECLEKQGKHFDALQRYREFVDYFMTLPTGTKQKRMNTLRDASDRIEALKRLLPRLKLKMPKKVPQETVVFLDGEEVPATSIEQTRWLEPGVHKLTVTVPGQTPEAWEIKLEPRQPLEELVRIPKAPPPAPIPRLVPVKPKPIVPQSAPPNGLKMHEVVMVTGVSFILTGTIAGGIPFGMAITKTSGVKQHCPDNKCDTPEWVQRALNVQALGGIATIGAGLASAGVLFLGGGLIAGAQSKKTKPRMEVTVLQLNTTSAMFGVKGSF